MKDETIFDDIRQYTKKKDREQDPHVLVPLILNLGVKKGTISRHLEENKVLCRSSGFNLTNGALSKISREIEHELLIILKQSLKQSVKIYKHYKQHYKIRTINYLHSNILSGKKYLESIGEPLDDFKDMFEKIEIDGIQDDDFIKNYIDYSTE
jgi:hypothetical protein